MRDDPFLKLALSAMLLCLLVLIAQRVPAERSRSVTRVGDPEIGRYELLIGEHDRAVGVHDTKTNQLYGIGGHRSRYPLSVPEEMLASTRAVELEARYYAPPVDVQQQLKDTAVHAYSVNMRAWAADQLGLGPWDGSAVVEELILALQDPEAEVAIAASRSLARKPDPAALPALRKALSHPEPKVVSNARQAIAAIQQ